MPSRRGAIDRDGDLRQRRFLEDRSFFGNIDTFQSFDDIPADAAHFVEVLAKNSQDKRAVSATITSFTLSAICWLTPTSKPGSVLKRSSKRCTRSCLVSFGGHVLYGVKPTGTSTCDGEKGSVCSSLRPTCVTTYLISGNERRVRRNSLAISLAFEEIPVGNLACSYSPPSLRYGRNSRPVVAASAARPTIASATQATAMRVC